MGNLLPGGYPDAGRVRRPPPSSGRPGTWAAGGGDLHHRSPLHVGKAMRPAITRPPRSLHVPRLAGAGLDGGGRRCSQSGGQGAGLPRRSRAAPGRGADHSGRNLSRRTGAFAGRARGPRHDHRPDLDSGVAARSADGRAPGRAPVDGAGPAAPAGCSAGAGRQSARSRFAGADRCGNQGR